MTERVVGGPNCFHGTEDLKKKEEEILHHRLL